MVVQATAPAELVEKIMSEGPLGFAPLARRLGEFRDGKPTHPSTLTRWAMRGIPCADGSRLRLEAIRLSGRLVTSWAAVLRFISAQQPTTPQAPAPRSPSERRRAVEQSDAELTAAGI